MKEFFPGIGKIRYEGPMSEHPLSFKCYDPSEKVEGKTMRKTMRFSVAYWHTFCGLGSDPFGAGTMKRPWHAASDPMKKAEDSIRAAFEFISKMGIDYYCFHDRDIAPEGKNLEESGRNLDRIVKIAKGLQESTGIKPLWGTANLFSNPRYMHGAATNPDPNVFAYAAAQVKKAMEVTMELGGENYVFWGGREGYETLLNTNLAHEQEQLASFLGMAVDYANEIGFKGQFLIEPKPKEPTKHQYDFDAATVVGFLKTHGLEKNFKLNIEANHATLSGHTFEHDLAVASANGMLGSIDANRGDLLLGWDTDQFPTDLYSTTYAMLVIMGQGGLGSGGVNFDAKVRRGSTDLEDLFHAHIGGMDAFARGLKIAAQIRKDGVLSDLVNERYAGYGSGMGKKIMERSVGFKELEKFAMRNGEPALKSGKQEMLENIINQYLLK